MTSDGFKTDITTLLDLSLDEVKTHFDESKNRKPLGEVTFFDLRVEDQSVSDGLHRMKYGVYLFFNSDGKCAYVGKTESSLANRFRQHLGFLKCDRYNQYLKRTLKIEYEGTGRKPKDYATQMLKMKNHSISIVNVTGQWDDVKSMLEPHCDFDHWDNWKSWSAKFLYDLEYSLQAIYCPPKPERYFLNCQKSHASLLKHQQKLKKLANESKNFAEVIARVYFK